ncbi:DUF3558 domain-containing protein [Pseudonocardia sp. DSM 110487]|uniref:DUF3558 domain-containing protein n=1 Tax=Pseudonocardia sp. DSM 110487 TaxID=2865833 RepID=UPI001C696CE2|nr:DUF3558 domain-containing protein [Pseudonocardia sp. DSM 110487]QYN34358.1 DUF3558 domain-containing protein [Pseudonocardia sp. DSM 110487]
MGVQRAVLGILIVVLTGCSTGGQASPADPPTTEEAAPTTVSLPPRPQDVPIDDVDPCTLLTREQRAELQLDQPPQPRREPSVLYPGDVSRCSIGGSEPAISISISAVTTAGIEFFTTGQTASEVRLIELAGFPAVVAAPVHTDDSCKVLIDTAPGQMVDVQARSAGANPPIPEEQLCRDAERAASLVLDTLLT